MAATDPDTLSELPQQRSKLNNNNSEEARLQDLIAEGTAKYAVKDYGAAAELYSQATELQADMNGEMSPQNADLLYSYGRCLYHVAVSSSDVLGSRVAGEKREESKKASKTKQPGNGGSGNMKSSSDQRVPEEVVTAVVEAKDGALKLPESSKDEKPYFQFTGDENFDDSDEDVEERTNEGGKDEDEAEEDDFSNAYEVLDLARILLEKRLSEVHLGESNGKVVGDLEIVKQLKERLADTYDLQAEISLEGERFSNAVVDLKAALKLKEVLYPHESSLIAEAHYKLSLALEFSSVTQQKNGNGEAEANQTAYLDNAMREEAATEMEAAIGSCNLRINLEESRLVSGSSTATGTRKAKEAREGIDDVKEMVKDMEQRLVELRQPPVSVNDPTGTGSIDGSNPLSGILGSILGESPEAQKSRLEEATQSAKDLTNLIRRRKPLHSDTVAVANPMPESTLEKRKLESNDEVEGVSTAKKVRVEKAADI